MRDKPMPPPLRVLCSADLETMGTQAQTIINELNQLKGAPGYFTETFCEEPVLSTKNGERIDAIRENIESRDCDQNSKQC